MRRRQEVRFEVCRQACTRHGEGYKDQEKAKQVGFEWSKKRRCGRRWKKEIGELQGKQIEADAQDNIEEEFEMCF